MDQRCAATMIQEMNESHARMADALGTEPDPMITLLVVIPDRDKAGMAQPRQNDARSRFDEVL